MRDPTGSPELAAAAAAEKLRVEILAMDVDSDASVAAAFARIESKSPVDVLVNNAGIERAGAIEESALADFRTCMETNYFGALRCIQAVVGSMRERKSGCIVNVASVAGRISISPMAAYCASKWALEGLSEALAQELKAFKRPGCDCRTRNHRNTHGAQYRASEDGPPLPAGGANRRAVFRFTRPTRSAVRGGG